MHHAGRRTSLDPVAVEELDDPRQRDLVVADHETSV
jgi:hypothetical protein